VEGNGAARVRLRGEVAGLVRWEAVSGGRGRW